MFQRILLLIAIGFFGFIGWVIYLANTGQKSVFFELVAAIPYGDKLGIFVYLDYLRYSSILPLSLKQWTLLGGLFI